MDTCYQLEKVCFRYSDQWVLEDFSLEVREGEILGIIGPNGSGKTSLLKLMAGLLRPQTGRVSLGHQDLAQLTPRALARRRLSVEQTHPIKRPAALRAPGAYADVGLPAGASGGKTTHRARL